MSQAPIALVNARLVDPAAGTETKGGVIVAEGLIAAVGADVTRDQVGSGATVVDCGGDVVSPGLIDMRVFVGEPGAESRETLASASAAAAAGGGLEAGGGAGRERGGEGAVGVEGREGAREQVQGPAGVCVCA